MLERRPDLFHEAHETVTSGDGVCSGDLLYFGHSFFQALAGKMRSPPSERTGTEPRLERPRVFRRHGLKIFWHKTSAVAAETGGEYRGGTRHEWKPCPDSNGLAQSGENSRLPAGDRLTSLPRGFVGPFCGDLITEDLQSNPAAFGFDPPLSTPAGGGVADLRGQACLREDRAANRPLRRPGSRPIPPDCFPDRRTTGRAERTCRVTAEKVRDVLRRVNQQA